MNWLGLSVRSLFGTLLGVLLGLVLFEHGHSSAWLVGLCAGVGCALLSNERSPLRGISVATAATWAAAAVDAHRLHVPTLSISTTLTGGRWLSYLVCILAAFLLGGATVRPSAKTRTAGT